MFPVPTRVLSEYISVSAVFCSEGWLDKVCTSEAEVHSRNPTSQRGEGMGRCLSSTMRRVPGGHLPEGFLGCKSRGTRGAHLFDWKIARDSETACDEDRAVNLLINEGNSVSNTPESVLLSGMRLCIVVPASERDEQRHEFPVAIRQQIEFIFV